MAEVMDGLPRHDRRLVELMAADANTSSTAMAVQIVREYLNLVRSAPDALPKNPLRRLAASTNRRGA